MEDYDGWVKIGTELDTKQFDKEIKYVRNQIEEIEYKLKQADLGEDVGDVSKLEAQYEKLNNRLADLIKKKNSLNAMPSWFEKISSSMTQIIKKAGKWALAVFGIRSAYLAIRKAMSTLSQYDEQLKTDIQYIQTAMATALEPIVRKLVDFALLLLQYIGAIIQKLTGKNPFENVNKNMAKANKSAKEMSKTLASFDEMNIVGDSSSSSKIETPSINITDVPELPKWIDDIIKNKDIILKFFMQLLIIWGLLKILQFAGYLADIRKGIDLLVPSLSKLSGLKLFGVLTGVALAIVGIVETIKAIIDFIKDPSWENFSKILNGLAIALAGVALAMIAINIANPVGWIILAIAGVTALMALIIKNWDKIKGWFNNIGAWVQDNIINPIKNKFNSLPGWLKTLIKGMINVAIQMINMLINGINLMLIPLRAAIVVVGKIMGKDWNLQTISIPKIPYVRKGAIVNMPNRGVLVGSAMAGESGHEGVLPLTDSQQMSLLGAEIGKYITVNLTNVTQMNGRQINRELKILQAEDDFAFNR